MTCNQCGADVPAGAAFVHNVESNCEPLAAQRPQTCTRVPHVSQAGGARRAIRDTPEEELWVGAYSPKAMTGSFVGAAV